MLVIYCETCGVEVSKMEDAHTPQGISDVLVLLGFRAKQHEAFVHQNGNEASYSLRTSEPNK